MSDGVRSSSGSSQPPPPHHPPSSPVVPPLSRHLAFVSTKPPFYPTDDYHRFAPYSLSSNDSSLVNGCGVVDREEDAIVVRSHKRKRTMDAVTFPSNNGSTSSGVTSISNSPCQTPVSAKGGIVNRSKAKEISQFPKHPSQQLVLLSHLLLLEVAVMTVL